MERKTKELTSRTRTGKIRKARNASDGRKAAASGERNKFEDSGDAGFLDPKGKPLRRTFLKDL